MHNKQLQINSGRVLLADPALPAGHTMVAAKGIWEVSVIYEAGRRGSLRRINAGIDIAIQGIDKYPERLDIDKRFVVTDSGLVGFFDQPCFIQPNTNGHDAFYTKCNQIASGKGWNSFEDGSAVVALAGNGEGIYVATTFTNQDGELVRVSIDLLDVYDEGFFSESFEN